MSTPDLTAKFEEERLRAHEQSQIVYLQGQIDELRRLIKDQTNKYNWAMEQTRKTEAAVVQVQSLFERHTEEVTQSIEASRRDIVGLRKEIAGALVKIEEGVKPLREMQSQIQQLAEARRQDRDQVFPWFARIEDTEQKILDLQSQIRETEERQRQLVAQLDRLREADAVALQEARRVGEELQVEKQNLRRQIVEGQQVVVDMRSWFDDFDARLIRIDEVHHRVELFAEQLPDIVADIKRVERISTERFLMNQERLEDMRHQSDEKLVALQETDERHLRQLTSWLERVDGWVRELEQRLSRSASRLEAAQHSHIARIAELEQRELQVIAALSDAFRQQADAVKRAHVESRELADIE
jgi:chromosome segregation ATPase